MKIIIMLQLNWSTGQNGALRQLNLAFLADGNWQTVERDKFTVSLSFIGGRDGRLDLCGRGEWVDLDCV